MPIVGIALPKGRYQRVASGEASAEVMITVCDLVQWKLLVVK